MDFLTSTPNYAQDQYAQTVWAAFEDALAGVDGIAYYRHPVFSAVNPRPPDFAIIAEGFEPLAVLVVHSAPNELGVVSETAWRISGNTVESPIETLGDHVEGLRRRLAVDRELRTKYRPYGILALPLFRRADMSTRFPRFFEFWRRQTAKQFSRTLI